MSVPDRFRIAGQDPYFFERVSKVYNVVQQFAEFANTDRMQEAINDVENFLATCDTEEFMDAMPDLRKICVQRTEVGHKFNEWRVNFVQRWKNDARAQADIQHSVWMDHLQRMLDRFAPAITEEEQIIYRISNM